MDTQKKSYADRNKERITVLEQFITTTRERDYHVDITKYDLGEMKAIVKFLNDTPLND